jgi:hypothetical protein
MTGIIAALETDYKVSTLAEEIYYLALALIAPLGPDYRYIGHKASHMADCGHDNT